MLQEKRTLKGVILTEKQKEKQITGENRESLQTSFRIEYKREGIINYMLMVNW